MWCGAGSRLRRAPGVCKPWPALSTLPDGYICRVHRLCLHKGGGVALSHRRLQLLGSADAEMTPQGTPAAAAYWGKWRPMGAYGGLWGPMGAHGAPRGPMGAYGGPWGCMAAYGSLWGPIGPSESSDPTQHAKGRTGDRPGPRKGATTRRNVTRRMGGPDGASQGNRPGRALRVPAAPCAKPHAMPLVSQLVMDLGHETLITGLLMQPRNRRAHGKQRVTSIKVSIGDAPKGPFTDVDDGAAFSCCPRNDTDEVSHVDFKAPVRARCVKITVLKWNAHVTMRCAVKRAPGRSNFESVWRFFFASEAAARTQIAFLKRMRLEDRAGKALLSEDAMRLFARFDVDGSGFLTKEDLKHVRGLPMPFPVIRDTEGLVRALAVGAATAAPSATPAPAQRKLEQR